MNLTDTQPAAPAPPQETGLLRHFSPSVRDAFARVQTTGDAAAADTVVLAIVRDHQPNKHAAGSAPLRDEDALIADLGFDSVAITEMVFFIEDLFRVSVSNEEILAIRTVGELRAFVRRKLAAIRPPAPSA